MQRVILHNIRSAYNVGSIFRTADGAGVKKIYLSGYTPQPVDRFGRVQPEIEKTSLGASGTVSWEAISENILETIKNLKQDGWTIVSVEQDERSISFYKFRPPEKVVYIFGNETEGLDQATLDASDSILEIQMLGIKESLNVAVTAGIVLFAK